MSGNLFNDPRIYSEMVDFGESDKMIKLVEKCINQTLTMG